MRRRTVLVMRLANRQDYGLRKAQEALAKASREVSTLVETLGDERHMRLQADAQMVWGHLRQASRLMDIVSHGVGRVKE